MRRLPIGTALVGYIEYKTFQGCFVPYPLGGKGLKLRRELRNIYFHTKEDMMDIYRKKGKTRAFA